MSRAEREKTIVDMYNNGYSIDDIWEVSGFNSKSSIWRVLNKYGVYLNRGRTSGPRVKKQQDENKITGPAARTGENRRERHPVLLFADFAYLYMGYNL